MCVNPNKSPDKIVRNWKLIPGEKKKKKKKPDSNSYDIYKTPEF